MLARLDIAPAKPGSEGRGGFPGTCKPRLPAAKTDANYSKYIPRTRGPSKSRTCAETQVSPPEHTEHTLMARTPMPAADAAADDTGTDTGTDTGEDTGTDTGTDTGEDQSETVLVTIAKGADGGYVVYSGDEPDEDEAAEGEGAAGAAPEAGATPPEGQHVDSIGGALKAAMDILQESENSAGEAGSSEDQFAAGFSGGTAAATPGGGRRGLKYPPA